MTRLGPAGHERIGVAEKIEREHRKQPPQRDQRPRQIVQDEEGGPFGQKRDDQQHQDRRARQTDEPQRGERRFARVFHATRIKIFAPHLQFGIFAAT